MSSPHELQTDFRLPFAYSLSHSFQSTLNCYRASCHPPMLCLLSILLSIRTIITQPFYQTFFIQHGLVHTFLGLVLRLLLFFRSVKLFCLHVLSQPYFFFPQRTTRPKVTVASPSVQVRYPFLRSISDIDVYPPSISDSHSWYMSSPRCILWSRHVNLGEIDWRFVRVRLLITCFLVA